MRKRDVFCFISAPLLVVLAIFIWKQIPFEDRDVISEHSYYVYVLLMKLLAGFLFLLAIIITLIGFCKKKESRKAKNILWIKLSVIIFFGFPFVIIFLIGVFMAVRDVKGTSEKFRYREQYGTVEKFLDKNDNEIIAYDGKCNDFIDDGTIYELLMDLNYDEVEKSEYKKSDNYVKYYVTYEKDSYLEINDSGYIMINIYVWGTLGKTYHYYFKADEAKTLEVYNKALEMYERTVLEV